jgi:hypothetical protein
MLLTALTALPAALSAVVMFGAMLVPSQGPAKRKGEMLEDAS